MKLIKWCVYRDDEYLGCIWACNSADAEDKACRRYGEDVWVQRAETEAV